MCQDFDDDTELESAVSKRRNDVMDKYECKVCGYIYDPAAGDPDQGVDPGTAWEDVPEGWFCPVCGAGKEDFEKVA